MDVYVYVYGGVYVCIHICGMSKKYFTSRGVQASKFGLIWKVGSRPQAWHVPVVTPARSPDSP